jgi:phosphatidylserine decarboxylase
MAKLTLTIPDALATRILNAFVVVYGVQSAEIEDKRTPLQIAKEAVALFVKDVVRRAEQTGVQQRAKSSLDNEIAAFQITVE